MARAAKLTAETMAEFHKLLSEGSPVAIACEVIGITRRTYDRWRARGRTATDDNDLYRLFCQGSKKAMGAAKHFHVRNIVRASETTWQASAWYLERVAPEHFASNAREIREMQKQINELAKHVLKPAPTVPDADLLVSERKRG